MCLLLMLRHSSFALIDDRVLDEEDDDTRDLEQALRWVRVYAGLLSLALKMQAEPAGYTDGLKQQADLYSRRLALWKERSQIIADRYP